MSQDTITIIEPNGVERSRPLSAFGLTIGRGGDNDISLAYDLISRHHTQITYENGAYYITDLNSANGTYLNNKKLPPDQPIAWQSGRPLRVGQVELILHQADQSHFEAGTGSNTVIGNFSDDTLMRNLGSVKKTKSRKWLYWLIGGLIFLCVLISAGASAYYYLLAG
jgi:pSer/pThr/pTyr-binding forkhead associated (FHA) protein